MTMPRITEVARRKTATPIAEVAQQTTLPCIPMAVRLKTVYSATATATMTTLATALASALATALATTLTITIALALTLAAALTLATTTATAPPSRTVATYAGSHHHGGPNTMLTNYY